MAATMTSAANPASGPAAEGLAPTKLFTMSL